MFRIQPHAPPQERIKSTQDHGLAPQSWRAIASEAQVAAHLSQHTNGQRAQAAQSMRHWPADPPPRAKHTCLQYASISPRRAARQPAHPARDLCTFATADRTDVQTPRDLITAANVKRRAGGRRGSGSNLHRNGLSMCTSSHGFPTGLYHPLQSRSWYDHFVALNIRGPSTFGAD